MQFHSWEAIQKILDIAVRDRCSLLEMRKAAEWIPVSEGDLPKPGVDVELKLADGRVIISQSWDVNGHREFLTRPKATHWRYIVGPVALEGK